MYIIIILLPLQIVLRDLAKIHSLYLGKMNWLNAQPWLEQRKTDKIVAMVELWSELLQHCSVEFPEFWTNERYESYHHLLCQWEIVYCY